MPSTLSSPYAGRPAGWVRTGGATGVRATSLARQHAGGRDNTPARPATCPLACFTWSTPGVSGVAPGPSALRGRSVHPEAHPPGEVPARLPYVVGGGRVRRT